MKKKVNTVIGFQYFPVVDDKLTMELSEHIQTYDCHTADPYLREEVDYLRVYICSYLAAPKGCNAGTLDYVYERKYWFARPADYTYRSLIGFPVQSPGTSKAFHI